MKMQLTKSKYKRKKKALKNALPICAQASEKISELQQNVFKNWIVSNSA